jgi:hypothetical protein
MKNATSGVCTRTSLSATTIESSLSSACSRSFRTSTRPFLGMMTPFGRDGALRVRSIMARRCPSVATMRMPSLPLSMYTPERLNRVSSVETAKIVLSIMSRSVPAAILIVVPPAAPGPSGNAGKSFASRLTTLNLERPARRSSQPAALDLSVTSSAVTSRAIS